MSNGNKELKLTNRDDNTPVKNAAPIILLQEKHPELRLSDKELLPLKKRMLIILKLLKKYGVINIDFPEYTTLVKDFNGINSPELDKLFKIVDNKAIWFGKVIYCEQDTEESVEEGYFHVSNNLSTPFTYNFHGESEGKHQTSISFIRLTNRINAICKTIKRREMIIDKIDLNVVIYDIIEIWEDRIRKLFASGKYITWAKHPLSPNYILKEPHEWVTDYTIDYRGAIITKDSSIAPVFYSLVVAKSPSGLGLSEREVKFNNYLDHNYLNDPINTPEGSIDNIVLHAKCEFGIGDRKAKTLYKEFYNKKNAEITNPSQLDTKFILFDWEKPIGRGQRKM